MQVGDLVQRSYPPDPGRIGLVIKIPDLGAQKYALVQWTDGIRDTIRSQFLEVVSESR